MVVLLLPMIPCMIYAPSSTMTYAHMYLKIPATYTVIYHILTLIHMLSSLIFRYKGCIFDTHIQQTQAIQIVYELPGYFTRKGTSATSRFKPDDQLLHQSFRRDFEFLIPTPGYLHNRSPGTTGCADDQADLPGRERN